MALARRKFRLARTACYFAVVGLLACRAAPLHALVGERVVSDRHTGLAIFGFDPVAYFVDAKPLAGRAEYELELPDAVWRFRNEGNRAAFAANPEIYRPRYGGYDPISIARGVAVAGNPTLWLVVGERLYLFYTRQARDAFGADPDTAIAAADERWPQVRAGLAAE